MKKILHLLIFVLFFVHFDGYTQCPGGETEVTVTVHTDNWGTETSWSLTGPGGTPVYLSVAKDTYDDGSEVHDVQTVCVPIDAELVFIIEDSYGDGMCSGEGDGYYSVSVYDFTYASGCDIGKGEETTFFASVPPNNNAVMDEINVPLFLEAGDVEITGEFRNKGVNTIASIDVNWTINDGTVNTKSLSSLSIASHETYDFTHDVVWVASDLLTTNDLKVWISNINGTVDDVPENDTVSSKIFILDEVAEKRVLIEHFTNASCPPCASQNPKLDALLEEKLNEWQVTHVAYHTWWPGTDPMWDFNVAVSPNPDLDSNRVRYYGVGGVPNVVLSGNKFQGAPIGVNQEMIDADWKRPGLFNVTTDLTYANDSVYVDVDLVSLADFNEGELVAHVLLVEDKSYDSAPGSNGETEFPDVMRYMFPDVNGTALGLPTFNQEFNLSFKHKMDDEVSDKMELIVFVQNNDGKEIYGVYQLLTNLYAPNVYFNVFDEQENVVPDNDFMANFSIAVRNVGGEIITSEDTKIYLRSDSINGEAVPHTKTISEGHNVITIKPDNDLKSQTTFYLGVETGLEGYNSIPVEATNITFKTGWGVGIEEIINENEVVFYPNPARDNIYLKLNVKERSAVEIQVYNESGQLVKISDKGRLSVGEHNINLDLSKLNNGLYFVKVTTENSSVTKKVQILK